MSTVVPAERALAYIAALAQVCPGLTPSHFARLAGINHSTLTSARQTGRIMEDTQERILAVSRRHYLLSPPPQMPTRLAAEHVKGLLDETGVSRNAVARTAEVNYQTVYNVVNERWPTVRWRIHAALTSLTADDLIAENFWVERWPTTTRLRALQANGWRLGLLGRSLGMNLSTLVNADPDSPMHAPVARRVQEVYESIGDTPGGSARASQIARGMGYLPPIYYEDDMTLAKASSLRDEQEMARTYLCIAGQTLENRSNPQIKQALGTTERHIGVARRLAGLRVEQNFDGTYAAVETREGAIAAVRSAVKPLHYWTTLDCLDDGPPDYVALWETLLIAEEAFSAA